MRALGLLFSLVAVLLLGLASPVLAAPPEPGVVPAPTAPPDDKGAELKRQGDKAMDSLQYEEAIAKYTAAFAASGDPAVLYNRGRVYQARSEFPEALADIERFQREASPALRGRVQQLGELVVGLRAKVTTLSIKSNVAGARVLVRERQVGTTPLAGPLKLNAGRAAVEVILEGYYPFRRDLDLAGGGTIELDAVLVTKERAGVLAVRTSGAATVFIDGEPVGESPVEVAVEAGAHKIVVRSEKYKDTETSAVVVAGQRRELVVDLEKRPPIYARWWFWTGVGVVLVGGAVITYALLSEKSAPQGDQFAPAQVRGPLLRW